MRTLQKSTRITQRTKGGSLKGKLDHVIASNDLQFQQWTDPVQNINPFEIEVTGWNLLSEPQRTDFIDKFSDHCVLFGEVL